MAFHLEGPWLSTTGKRKGKKKWASAEAKADYEQSEREWKELQKRWGVEAEGRKRSRGLSSPVYKPAALSYRGIDQPHVPSLDSGIGNATKPETQMYTGSNVVGITILHKSCLQPVFSKEAAIDAAKMRR